LIISVYFSTPKNIFWWPLSWFIRFMESTNRPTLYHSSHVALRIGDYIYEAVFFLGVRKISFYEWRGKNKISVRYNAYVTREDFDKVQSFCEGSIGVPYAFMELFGIMYSRMMFKLFKKTINNPFNILKRKVKCTEFIFEAIKKSSRFVLKSDINNLGVKGFEDVILEKDHAIPK